MAGIRRLSSIALVTLVAAAAAGCAGQGDIDRTQPDKVDKSIFVNADGTARTFYYRKTTTGVPPTSAYAYEGIQGSLLKVRFEIQEQYLLGYRAYDYAPGSEGQFTSGANNMDTPFLMFPITSQFDVKREYNPATGEQTNVISENTTDRPWNERQYMRVNWSQNLADPTTPDSETVDPTNPFFPAQTIPVGFSVGQGDQALVDQNQPIMTHDYVDFTTVEIRTPDYNACMQLFDTYDDSGPWGCGPAQITYRNSLLPVGDNEYEPLSYPDNQTLYNPDGTPVQAAFDPYGNQVDCTPDALAAAGLSGADCQSLTVGQFSKFGFFRSVRQNYNAQVGSTTQAREYLINRWNIWQNTIQRDASGSPILDNNGNPVRLPYSERKTRVITYYTNPEFPPDVWDEANAVVQDWNQAMKMTVAGAQWAEKNPGRALAMADLTTAAQNVPDIIVLKHNDCELGNVQNFVSAHPDVLDMVKQQVSTGTLDIDSVVDGTDTADLEKACSALYSVTASLPAGDARHFDWERNGDLRYSFIYWVDRPQPDGPLGYGPPSADPETGEIVSASAYIYGASLDTYAQFAVDSINLANGNLDPDDLLSGKTISDVLAETAGMQQLRKHETLSDANRSAAYARFKSLGSQADRLVKVGAGADDRTVSSVAGTQLQSLLFNDDVLPGILPGYKPGGTPPPDVVNTAMGEEWFSSQAREARKARLQTLAMNGCLYMGEFADDAILSTALQYDQMKLGPEDMFKALRIAIFRGLADHEMGHTMGLRHNFSASTDALNYGDQYWQAAVDPTTTDTQKEVNEANYEYASVMDYGARFSTDISGLGKYDMAAIRFGYGQLIDLIPQSKENLWNGLTSDIFFNDYKKLPAETSQSGDPNDISAIGTSATFVASYKDEINSLLRTGGAYAERPYKFCSDEFEGNYDCKTWDRGANQQEVVGDVTDSFRNYYVFNAYKRGRTTWQIDTYLNRLESHYFNKYTEAFQFFYYFGDQLAGTDFGDDLMLASIDALNALGAILETPEPGLHCLTPYSPNVLTPPIATTDCGSNPTSTLNLPDAKPYYIEFSNDFYYTILRTGSLYEKLEALFTLTTTEATFFKVDTFADANRYSVNFYQIFRDQVINLLSGVIRNDPSSYGATLGEGNVVQSTPVVDTATYGVLNPTTPAYAQPGVPRLDTPVNLTIRYWALLLSMGRLGSTWDATLDFQNFMAVSVKGSDDDFTVSATTPVVEYTHPETGVIYRAPDNSTPRNIGAQILSELISITGTQGTPGTIPTKYGVNTDGSALPDWYTAKAAVAAAADQDTLNAAQTTFALVDQVLEYRVDLISDIRLFRKQLMLLNTVSQ
ncbi:MAG TPA: zinc-dependent metalloprotease [Polyangia bacterium]|nr:zinc-dependent metalloprotease [Polyangia bacterium]